MPQTTPRLALLPAVLICAGMAPACSSGSAASDSDAAAPGSPSGSPGGSGTGKDAATGGTGSEGGAGPGADAGPGTAGPVDARAPASDAPSLPAPTDAGTSGCGVTPAVTGSQSLQLTVNGTVRTYVLSIPANYAASTPEPLVFGYQGVGGSGKGSQSSYGLEAPLASRGQTTTNDRAIFVYPDALVGSNPQDPTNTDYDYSPTGVDFAFFDALVKTLSANYCVDAKRVFVTGISAGGIFTNMLGCYRGGVIRAIAPLASEKPWSYTGGAVKCSANVAVWIAHGENDPYSSFTDNGIPARDFWVGQNACTTTTVTDPTTPNACVDYQGCESGFPVVWCVHDEGHNWPSTSSFICMDAGVCFDAGPAIWSFFSSF